MLSILSTMYYPLLTFADLCSMMKELVPDRRAIPGLEWMEEGVSPRLSCDSLVYIGLRDIDKVSSRSFVHQFAMTRHCDTCDTISLYFMVYRLKESVLGN
jgi:hypothetical protein